MLSQVFYLEVSSQFFAHCSGNQGDLPFFRPYVHPIISPLPLLLITARLSVPSVADHFNLSVLSQRILLPHTLASGVVHVCSIVESLVFAPGAVFGILCPLIRLLLGDLRFLQPTLGPLVLCLVALSIR